MTTQLERFAPPAQGAEPTAGLVARFEEQAARAPHAPALVAGDTVVTYGELDGLADRVARRLIDRGVRAEDVVGVLLPSSPTWSPLSSAPSRLGRRICRWTPATRRTGSPTWWPTPHPGR